MVDVSVEGKRVVVTGGGKGLGRAYARRLVERGASVAIIDVDEAAATATAREIVAAGGVCEALVGDIGRRDSARALIQRAAERLGGIDGLVNNAGILRDAFLADITEADWQAMVGAHLAGTLWCTQAAVDLMPPEGGSIVNITSKAANGNAGRATYAAAKAGIAGFTYSWALELADRGIRVNAVAPAAATGMAGGLVDNQGRPRTGPSVTTSGFPPEAVAPMVVYLISDASARVSGQVLFAMGPVIGLVGNLSTAQKAVHTAGWTEEAISEQFRQGWRRAFAPIGVDDVPYPWYGGVRAGAG